MKQRKSIGRLISCIHRNTHIYLHHELDKYNLGSGQLHFLILLYNKDGVNQETLAETIKIDKATCARAIKKLMDQGFITRKKDVHDKRSYKICLTTKAIELKPTIRSILKNSTKELLNGFTKEEEILFFEFLERISKNAMTLTKTGVTNNG
jgi:DNA-binding MarR family transcriptional regulator